MKRLISVHQDNPAYFNHDPRVWDYTPAGRSYLRELASMTGHRKERMLHGLWVGAEGTVFPNFAESRHVLHPAKRFVPPLSWPVFVCVDPGYDHPCAVIFATVTPTERLVIFDEIYQSGLTIAQVATRIREKCRGLNVRGYYLDPQDGFKSTQASPQSIAAQFRANALRFFKWPPSTDKRAMVDRVRDRLDSIGLQVTDNCTNTIAEFQSWMHKRNTKGEALSGDDQYEDRNNHAMDAVCGLVALQPKHNGQIVRVL